MLGVHKSAEAAARLVTNNLQPNDLVGIFTSSGTTSVDFTRNRDLLLAAIARLRPHPLSGASATTSCPTLDSYAGYVIPRHLDPAVESAALGRGDRLQLFHSAHTAVRGLAADHHRSGGTHRMGADPLSVHHRPGGHRAS